METLNSWQTIPGAWLIWLLCVVKRPERPYLFSFQSTFFLCLSFLFLKTDHRHEHKAYSYSIYKDYKLVYIFHTTTTTMKTSHLERQTGRTTCTSPRTKGPSDLFSHFPSTQGRSFGPTRNTSTTSHLSIIQMSLEHLFHPI